MSSQFASMVPSLWKRATEGVTGALEIDALQYCILAAGTAIAWAYTIELDLLILYTFRRRKGLYFWSLLISSWGCTLHALGFILKFLVGATWLAVLPFIEVGWVTMVTGQAFVLFSRLHLVVRNRRTLRTVLFMIILDALVLHTPTIVLTYGSNSPNGEFWAPKFNIMERIQLVGFCLQEFAISTIYIVATVRLLGSIYHSMTRKVMVQLLIVNGICIAMDIILICLEFTYNYVPQASVKPMIYAIKLKLEFAVLNQLMGLTKAGFTEENQFQGGGRSGGRSGGHNTHELQQSRNQDTINKDVEGGATAHKQGTWSTVRANRGSFSNQAAQVSISHPEHIYQTKHVEVITAPKSPSNGDISETSGSSTLVAGPNRGQPKADSLMGTSIVHMPGDSTRAARRSRTVDPDGRESSPISEGEKGILRRSQDSEKEGTRWIEGLDH